MSDENKRNLLYFEAVSMRELFDSIQIWQNENDKRLLSLSIERDGGKFCCIALTNPSEMIIVDGYRSGGVDVTDQALKVYS
jgi:hypothetical protein